MKHLRKLIGCLFICVFSLVVRAGALIPETIDVGAFSVNLKLDQSWHVAVHKDKEMIIYQYTDSHSMNKKNVVELTVRRLTVPAELVNTDFDKMADAIVKADKMQFHRQVFGEFKHLTRDKSVKSGGAFGEGRHYRLLREEFGPYGQYFAHIVLLKDADFEKTRVVYLVTGWELNTRKRINPEYADMVNDIVNGLKISGH